MPDAISATLRSALAPLMVAAAAGLVLCPNLGGPPLFDEDEPKNAACSLAMLDAGDWVVPTFNGKLRVAKPPLVNWLQMAGYACLGRDEAGARAASAAATMLSCLLTWAIASRLLGHQQGLWAGLVMASCIWTAVGGRAATPDAALVAATTAALWLFAGGLHASAVEETAEHHGLRLSPVRGLALGSVMGLAVLAKGPVGFIVPAGAFILFVLWETRPAGGGQLRAWASSSLAAARQMRPLTVIAAAVAVALPWYLWVGLRTDWEWPRRFLLEHNVARFNGPLEGHSGSPLYYLPVLLAGLFPWSIASLLIVRHTAGSLGRDEPAPRRRAVRLLVAWSLSWILFFSLAGTKLPGYVWPAYPALAAITADYWIAWRHRRTPGDWLMPLAWGSLVAVGLALVAVGPIARHGFGVALGTTWAVAAAGLVSAAGGLLAWRLAVSGTTRRFVPATLAAVAVGLTATLASVATEEITTACGPRSLLADVPEGSRIAMAGTAPPSTVFYWLAGGHGEAVPQVVRPCEAAERLRRGEQTHFLADAEFTDRLLPQLPATHRVLARSGGLPGGRPLALIGPSKQPETPSEPWISRATRPASRPWQSPLEPQ